MALSGNAEKLWQTATALALKAASVSPRLRALPPLLFFTDPERTPEPWITAARLPAGSAVVFRAFSAPDAFETGQRLLAACQQTGVKLLVGRDDALCEALGADGVHLPERDLGRAKELRRIHPDWLITGAVHSADNMDFAKSLDAVVVSPVFPAGGASASKAALGVDRFNALTQVAPCPVYALGGIHAGNVEQLLNTQACGIAGVDAFQSAFSG